MQNIQLKVLCTLLLFVVTLSASAQMINLNAYKPCEVAIIDEEEAQKDKYGWWSKWCELKKNIETRKTPCSLTLQPNKRYFVIIYNPHNEMSDGVVLKGVMYDKKKEDYYFSEDDFVEWHNLACE